MRSIEVFAAQEPLTEVRLAVAEKRLKIGFPSQYRRFLLANNGGHTGRRRELVLKGSRSAACSVEYFLAVPRGAKGHPWEQSNLERYLRYYRGRVPADLIPIAHDAGGNLICIGVAGKQRGKIYFWDHEEESCEGEPPTEGNLSLLADSFYEFLASLSGEALPDEMPPTLHHAVNNRDRVAVSRLLEAGANPDQVITADRVGGTALWQLAFDGPGDNDLAIAKLLIESGANLEARDKIMGRTPLYLAAWNGHLALVKLLVDAGARVDAAGIATACCPSRTRGALLSAATSRAWARGEHRAPAFRASGSIPLPFSRRAHTSSRSSAASGRGGQKWSQMV